MADLAAARENMVESQVRPSDVTDVRIHDAMRVLRREEFVPGGKAYLAYADVEVEYAPGRWLMRPRDVAKLVQAARPMPGERVLAICAPYAAAMIAGMGIEDVRRQDDDLMQTPAGEYDLIICEGAVGHVPDSWLSALALNGRLAVVERDGPVGKAYLYINGVDGVGRRELFDSTPPVMPGFEAQHGFAF